MPEERNTEVTLDAVLLQREARAQKQQALKSRYPGKPVVCLLVNMPGPVKRTEKSDRVFDAGLAAFVDTLSANTMPLLAAETDRLPTGCEAYLVPDGDAETVKRVACALESTLPYGRLLDIDVHAPDGGQISRTALGLPERGCMVCGAEGAACASRRLHPLSEILAAFDRLANSAPEARP